MPDMVLKPVKTNMNASPSKKTFNFFTWCQMIACLSRSYDARKRRTGKLRNNFTWSTSIVVPLK